MKKRLAFLAFWLAAALYWYGDAQAAQTLSTSYYKQVLTNGAASADHTTTNSGDSAALGKAIDFGLAKSASIQANWASLTGTINATVTVYASVDCSHYTIKNDSLGNPVTFTLSGANGSDIFSLNGVVTEPCYQVRYAAVGVTGGTVNIFAYGKI